MSKTDNKNRTEEITRIDAKIGLDNFDGDVKNVEIQVRGVSIDLKNETNRNILARNVMNAFEKTVYQIYSNKDLSKLN